jgi:tetratricopeptide (TPR) repeat protein
MSTSRTIRLILVFLWGLLLAGVQLRAQSTALGKVEFPTSGGVEAQGHFLRGLAALHSFWFEEALEEFRKSTEIESDFMMGYWGEAMALNHPLWAQQDTEGARTVLKKIRETNKLTDRERAYISAVKLLYGEGDKLSRDRAYSVAMGKIYRDYPEDLEAACFYALSLLGTVRPGDRGFLRQMQAGAIALEVFQKNPNHPGAAHYIIHAFDDPEHAILALPAARRYAEIAPAAHHARHMPSHIFLQLGMWPDAAASNESAWAASKAWVKQKHLSSSALDYHSLHWLLYAYLQQGRYREAEELLLQMGSAWEDTISGSLSPSFPIPTHNYQDMAAAFVVETQRWQLAAGLFERPRGQDGETTSSYAPGVARRGHPAGSDAPGMKMISFDSDQIIPAFIRGLAAAQLGSGTGSQSVQALQGYQKQLTGSHDTYEARVTRIRELEVEAVEWTKKRNFDRAIEQMKEATALEEEMSPPSGPPILIKPSHELLGEILLKAGKPAEAAQEFAKSLLRQPNRARSRLGAARAAAQNGDRVGAVEAYNKFLKIWQKADPELPELGEARAYVADK